MEKKLNYITYQTFPANTANSIQTISTVKHLNRLGLRVALIYPLRNKDSSDNIIAEWTYVPQENTYGDDKFTVIITDDEGSTKEQIINVEITKTDDPPRIIETSTSSADLNRSYAL